MTSADFAADASLLGLLSQLSAGPEGSGLSDVALWAGMSPEPAPADDGPSLEELQALQTELIDCERWDEALDVSVELHQQLCHAYGETDVCTLEVLGSHFDRVRDLGVRIWEQVWERGV